MQSRAPGIRLIAGYKIGKAIVQVLAALFLFYGATHGLTAELADFAEKLRQHAVHAWSNMVAAALLRFTKSRHGLWWTAYALLGDAFLSSVEAWALRRGYAWGEWLVVATTSGLVPFEIYALAHHVRVGRVVLLVLNLAIVAYLIGRARRRLTSRTAAPDARPASPAAPAPSAGRAGVARR